MNAPQKPNPVTGKLTLWVRALRRIKANEEAEKRAAVRRNIPVLKTRQAARRELFRITFQELQKKHGPEGRRRLRAMARTLSHRRYQELR